MKSHMTYPFYDGLGTPDEKKELKQEIPKDLEGLLEKFEESLGSNKRYPEYHDHIKESIDQILTPEQINIFLQQTMKYEDHKKYSRYTGVFISQLIQNSYDAGHNNFTINTTALKEIDFLGYRLAGTAEKPIEVNIKGNAGGLCGWYAKYSTFAVYNKNLYERLLRNINPTNKIKLKDQKRKII